MNRPIVTLIVLSAWSCIAASASAQTFPEPECRDNEDSFQVCDKNMVLSRCVAEAQALDCKASGRCTDLTTLPCPTKVEDGTVTYCCTACAPIVNSSIPRDEVAEGNAESAKRAMCMQALACAGPPPPPGLGIFSEYCGGLHTIYWTRSEGTVRYQVQAKGREGYPWALVSENPAFPGIIVDVGSEQFACSGDADGDFYARARACNACGCSAWSTQYSFTYFRGECR
jgi:hypothetical protein